MRTRSALQADAVCGVCVCVCECTRARQALAPPPPHPGITHGNTEWLHGVCVCALYGCMREYVIGREREGEREARLNLIHLYIMNSGGKLINCEKRRAAPEQC